MWAVERGPEDPWPGVQFRSERRNQETVWSLSKGPEEPWGPGANLRPQEERAHLLNTEQMQKDQTPKCPECKHMIRKRKKIPMGGYCSFHYQALPVGSQGEIMYCLRKLFPRWLQRLGRKANRIMNRLIRSSGSSISNRGLTVWDTSGWDDCTVCLVGSLVALRDHWGALDRDKVRQ